MFPRHLFYNFIKICLYTIFTLWVIIPHTTPNTVFAQDIGKEVQFEGVIESIITPANETEIETAIVKLDLKDSVKAVIAEFAVTQEAVNSYEVGDKVIVSQIPFQDGEEQYFVVDHVRKTPLALIFTIFLVVVLGVSRIWGLRSLLGLMFSFLVIFLYILPMLAKGYDPILISVIGASVIMLITFYLSHGINQKTHIALVSTFIALLVTALLADTFTNLVKLTGYASEEAAFLQNITQGTVNIRGLLLAGIIIGTLGILDDITISQAAVVEALRKANPKYSSRKLFFEAMSVGNDHIASLVNTLVLVYAGSSLPLLLLFIDSQKSYLEIINYELIAEEIVRTLVGSTGLVLAVPITTLLAAHAPRLLKQVKTYSY